MKQGVLAPLRGNSPTYVPLDIHHLFLQRGTLEREMRNGGLGIVEKSVSAYEEVMPHVSIEKRKAWGNGVRTFYITYHTPFGNLHAKDVLAHDGSL